MAFINTWRKSAIFPEERLCQVENICFKGKQVQTETHNNSGEEADNLDGVPIEEMENQAEDLDGVPVNLEAEYGSLQYQTIDNLDFLKPDAQNSLSVHEDPDLDGIAVNIL